MSLEKKVQRGIKVLDERGPYNWHRMVIPDTLDIGDSNYCVLGQLYGDYQRGMKVLGLRRLRRYGFAGYNFFLGTLMMGLFYALYFWRNTNRNYGRYIQRHFLPREQKVARIWQREIAKRLERDSIERMANCQRIEAHEAKGFAKAIEDYLVYVEKSLGKEKVEQIVEVYDEIHDFSVPDPTLLTTTKRVSDLVT